MIFRLPRFCSGAYCVFENLGFIEHTLGERQRERMREKQREVVQVVVYIYANTTYILFMYNNNMYILHVHTYTYNETFRDRLRVGL